MLLADPAIEAHCVEDVLSVALQSDHLVLLLEIFKADATGNFTFVLDWIKVLAGKGL